MCISEPANTNADERWYDFEKTGSIDSYLRYKGIFIDNKADGNGLTSAASIRDGEPVGNY